MFRKKDQEFHETMPNRKFGSPLMKSRSIAIIFFVFGVAFLVQFYRNFVINQFRNFGAILPGHIPQADIGRDIYEIVESRGFKSERHYVTNSKGYILQLSRIINPYVKDRSKLRPVLLHHGFQCTGTLYIITNNGKLLDNGKYVEYDSNGNLRTETPNSLGFLLASSGYDVWLANYRGSPYSSNHTKLSTDESKFWNFNIDDLIEEDYPVLLDYVLKKSNSKTLGYVGHSLGNFMMFGLLSKHPEYSQIIKPFVALSPVFYMNDLKTPLRHLRYFKFLFRSFPLPFLHVDQLRTASSTFCSNVYLRNFCHRLFRHYLGIGSQNIDMDRLGVFMDNIPMGSGGVVASHLGQIINYGPTYFNFGNGDSNMKYYKSETVPFYDESLINSTDIAFVYSKDDWFNTPVNIDLLKKKLTVPLLGDLQTPDPTWGHMELLWADKAGEIVNRPVLEWLNKYKN